MQLGYEQDMASTSKGAHNLIFMYVGLPDAEGFNIYITAVFQYKPLRFRAINSWDLNYF